MSKTPFQDRAKAQKSGKYKRRLSLTVEHNDSSGIPQEAEFALKMYSKMNLTGEQRHEFTTQLEAGDLRDAYRHVERLCEEGVELHKAVETVLAPKFRPIH